MTACGKMGYSPWPDAGHRMWCDLPAGHGDPDGPKAHEAEANGKRYRYWSYGNDRRICYEIEKPT